jgi:hypothetical protein
MRQSYPALADYRLTLLATALAAVLAGCQHSASSVHGEVTYEGSPVGRGQVTLMPASRHGAAWSGPIVAGKYTIDNVPAGPKIAQIIGVKQIQFAKTQAEAAKRDRTAVPETADEVPADAEGNNQAVETTGSDQELNFNLKKPRDGSPR